MLCIDHFNDDVVFYSNHGKSTRKPKQKRKHAFDKGMAVSDTKQVVRGSDKGEKSFPEDYTVEGVEKEVVQRKKARVNICKEEKKKKDLCQEYSSTKTKTTMPAKCVKPRCKEKDKRGGRQSAADIERDQLIRQEISDHIDRFPRVELHWRRASSTREYLSSELTRKRMYNMFIQEWFPKTRPPSFMT
ncbi:hypothetical protein ElyMa_000224400 [Elysia marginata]|uniref:THAP-type domain-containing protein n=1 Tax=Elysia marginata TaxID=1093978 RepID=A0AAV4EZY3_9GAST|nr:hypothetical protein ElyMa_000224400 [Elysia marginata]